MMMDYITLAGFILAVFGTGVAVGKIVEKIERLERKKEDEEHNNTSKNDICRRTIVLTFYLFLSIH